MVNKQAILGPDPMSAPYLSVLSGGGIGNGILVLGWGVLLIWYFGRFLVPGSWYHKSTWNQEPGT